MEQVGHLEIKQNHNKKKLHTVTKIIEKHSISKNE